MIARVVEQMVANSVVGTIAAGSAEPAAARRAMTPVGSSVTEEVLMARNSTMALLAVLGLFAGAHVGHVLGRVRRHRHRHRGQQGTSYGNFYR